jgi:hypothetical protein
MAQDSGRRNLDAAFLDRALVTGEINQNRSMLFVVRILNQS